MTLHVVIVEREPLLRACLPQVLTTAPGIEVTGIADSITRAEYLPASTPADVCWPAPH